MDISKSEECEDRRKYLMKQWPKISLIDERPNITDSSKPVKLKQVNTKNCVMAVTVKLLKTQR